MSVMMTDYEERIVDETYREFVNMQTYRATFAAHWEEVAELVLPTSRNTFYYGNYNFPGEKKTDRQVDATAMLALSRFSAIMDSLLTPRNMLWHMLEADDEYLMKQRGVRLYYEAVTRALFKYRYSPLANFSAQNANHYEGLGAFGTANLFIDQLYDVSGQRRGIRYLELPLGEVFIRENHQKLVDGFIRWYRLTPRQACKAFKPEKLPPAILEAASKGVETPYEFLHRVVPRDDYIPGHLSAKGKLYGSYHICLTPERTFLREGGYNTFPLASSRYIQTPGETYGRSPAMTVLPAIKTLNSEKKDFLTQGHRAVSPVLLVGDDGMVDISMRPGAQNKGGMSPDGKPLIGTLPIGNIQVSKEMMDEERSIINDVFLVTLFQILEETPQMTATEVLERVNEKGILLAPTIGRQQSEYLGPMIDREIDVLAQQHLLPPMPPILREAKGNYHVVYTSPLSRAARAQEVAGFGRTLEMALTVVNATQDPSPLDNFEFDTIIPETAGIQAVPERWMASADSIAKKRQARAAAQQRQEAIQAAPAQAAMMKAKAMAAQAGQQPEQGNGPQGNNQANT